MAERSDALKKAQQKYMERFSVARIRMEREKYEIVQEYAEGKGMSVNALVVSLLDQAMTTGGPITPTEAGAVSLPPDTLKTAQEAAEAAGEDLPQFLDRAVTTQAQQDALDRKMEGGERHGN